MHLELLIIEDMSNSSFMFPLCYTFELKLINDVGRSAKSDTHHCLTINACYCVSVLMLM